MRKQHYQSRHGSLHRWMTALLLFLFTAGYASTLTVTSSVTGTCNGNDASVTFSLSGGTAGTYYYQLTGGGGYHGPQTSPVFSGLGPGYYSLYVYGPDSAFTNLVIGSRISITPTITNTTCPANQGAITTAVSGGTAPYTYAWSTGAGSVSSLSGLAGGGYRVTVTDAASCTAVADTMYVQATSSMSVGITSSGPSCSPTLTATTTGSSGTVSYHWNNGAASSSISSLASGATYAVTATDANACTAAAAQYVSYSTLYIDSSNGSNVSITYPGCSGSTGTITVHIRIGQAPYTWHWSGSASTDSIASGLSNGSYGVTVTDANGCTGSGNYYISTGPTMQAYINAVNNATCGASDGTVQATVYGGSGTYSYVWSAGSGTTALHSNLTAGNYSVTATDQNGCIATATYTLVGEAAYSVSATSTASSCDTSQHTGTATAIVSGSGGTAPYTYTWYQYYANSPYILGTGQTITGLSAGIYGIVLVTDANGCVPQNYSNNDSIYIPMDPACFDHITGYIYADANSNCTKDAGENAVTNAYVIVTTSNGSAYYANPDSAGFYDVQVLPGSYSVALHMYTDSGCASGSCTAQYSISLPTAGQSSNGNNFGISLGTLDYNLGIHTGCQPSIPGGTKDYWVYYYNSGMVSAPNTVVSFVHDPNLTLASTTPLYSNYDAATHTISWNIGNLAASPSAGWQHVQMTFNVPNTLTLGSYLACTAEITPTAGDCNTSNNTESLYDLVVGSHDPNEKEVYPTGPLADGDNLLHYTVRFQNDGNAPALLVVVQDTLSPYVDPATVVPGASSHPYKFSLSGNGLLTFRFDNINLPDSVHDEPHSKGFVNYTVHTKPNLALGTEVKNTAYIYFDYNSAVVTNTTVNTRSDLTGITPVSNNSAMQVAVSPNPVQEQSVVHFIGATGQISFELMDVTGKKVMETTTTKDLTLSGSTFAAGIYTYLAKDQAGNIRSGKISITH